MTDVTARGARCAPVDEAAARLDDLVHRVASSRETIALTDRGRVAALLVSPGVLEDLEDDLAVADYRRRKAEGTLGEGIPHEEVRRLLNLPASPDHMSRTGSRNSRRLPAGSSE